MHGISLRGHWMHLFLRAASDWWVALVAMSATPGLRAAAQPTKCVEAEQNVLIFLG